MKFKTRLKILILGAGLLFTLTAKGQEDQVESALIELSAALDSNDQDRIESANNDLISTLKRVNGRDDRIEMQLECVDYFILNHSENLDAHDLIYRLLRHLIRHDRRKQFTTDILERIKAFNLLTCDTEMIENNVKLAEKIVSYNADSLGNYLRNNSNFSKQIMQINEELETIETTMKEAQGEFHSLMNQTMDSMQMVSTIDSLKRVQIQILLNMDC